MMRSVRKEITIAHAVVMSGGNASKGERYRSLKARARVNTRVDYYEYHVTRGSNAKAAREMYKVTLLCRLLSLFSDSSRLSLPYPSAIPQKYTCNNVRTCVFATYIYVDPSLHRSLRSSLALWLPIPWPLFVLHPLRRRYSLRAAVNCNEACSCDTRKSSDSPSRDIELRRVRRL